MRRRDAEHTIPIKAAICHEDVTVRIESEEVTEGLHGDDCAGNGFILRLSYWVKRKRPFIIFSLRGQGNSCAHLTMNGPLFLNQLAEY